ncbi:MAG: hypothetical protein UU87_C0002G0025 [Parcubacteria group bacterium GW2011_GWA2_42_11]|nr:MAG: hypothetical protein UU87_C0002G0025 [Parcubacteria group bacterium GW2011_GWA2_42_11]
MEILVKMEVVCPKKEGKNLDLTIIRGCCSFNVPDGQKDILRPNLVCVPLCGEFMGLRTIGADGFFIGVNCRALNKR